MHDQPHGWALAAPSVAPGLLLGLLLGLPLLPGCGATGAATEAKATPYTPLPDPDPESIGYFLTEFDASLRAWTNLALAGSGREDERIRRGLEKEMSQRARKRQADLLDELENGAPKNRAVAAAALGFTGDPAVVGPLYAALSDPDEDVVLNSLVGLGHLASPDTPPAEVCYLLGNDPDAWVRSNAAYVLSSVVGSGGETPELVLRSCREALADPEPGVRAQCASTLGLAHDVRAIDELGDLLYDDVDLVAAAAASALSLIGRTRLEHKGEVARDLSDALDRLEPKRRDHLLRELLRLSEVDYGEDAEGWQKWARRLP